MSRRILPLILFFCLGAGLVQAGPPLRTQTLQLQAGWNAVFLQVEPTNSNPDTLFAGLPVDTVTRFLEPVKTAEFLNDPQTAGWKKRGYRMWYAPTREEAVLNSLHFVEGNVAYLIKASSAFTWNVTGTVAHRRLKWRTDAFNLTGLPVDPAANVTFSQFFAAAGASAGTQIYFLTAGKWALVTAPASTYVHAGEAYWIYNASLADFQGPVDLQVNALGALDFGASSSSVAIGYVNNSTTPLNLAIEPVSPVGAPALPLRCVVTDLTHLTNSYPSLGGAFALPSLAGGYAGKVTLACRREEMPATSMATLLKVTGGGCQFWIPVSASK